MHFVIDRRFSVITVLKDMNKTFSLYEEGEA